MVRRVLTYASLGLVVLMLLVTPAGAANKEHQQLMADIRMLQEQVQRQQLVIASLTDVLKTITAKLDEQAGTSRKLLADQKLVIDAMAGDLRVVREKADDNNTRLGTLALDVEVISKTLPQIAAAASAGQPLPGGAAGGPPAAGNPATPPQGRPEQPGASPSQLFQQAQSDYMAGNFPLAISGFISYLGSWSISPQAPDAQLYLGDSYRKLGKFDDAIDAYTKVVNNYPASPKVAEALYKRGAAYEDAGDKVRARESYQAVIDKYPPDNQWAIMAKAVVGRIKGPGQP
jgi:tol-pal system protein YbgF